MKTYVRAKVLSSISTQNVKEPTLIETKQQVSSVEGKVTETQEQVSKIKQHHVFRRKINGNYIEYFDSEDNVVMRYRMVKDDQDRIIELIPEEV